MTINELHKLLEDEIEAGNGQAEVGRSTDMGYVRLWNGWKPDLIRVVYDRGFYRRVPLVDESEGVKFDTEYSFMMLVI